MIHLIRGYAYHSQSSPTKQYMTALLHQEAFGNVVIVYKACEMLQATAIRTCDDLAFLKAKSAGMKSRLGGLLESIHDVKQVEQMTPADVQKVSFLPILPTYICSYPCLLSPKSSKFHIVIDRLIMGWVCSITDLVCDWCAHFDICAYEQMRRDAKNLGKERDAVKVQIQEIMEQRALR